MPEWEPGEPRDAIDGILRRAEFRDDRNLIEQGRDWLFEQFDRLLSLTFGGSGGTWVAWAVVALLVVLVVVLVVRVVGGVRRDPGGSPTPADTGRPAVDWRREAEAHEAAGRWSDAVRCLYRAVVADLAARGVVDEVPGRTAGTYRALVRQAMPAIADPFDDATARFEAAWYGGTPAGEADLAEMRRHALAVGGARAGGGDR